MFPEIFWDLGIGNRDFGKLAVFGCFLTNFNILGIFLTQFWSLSMILSSEFQNSNFPEIFWNFWKLSGNSQTLTIFEKWNIFSSQFLLLILIFHLKLVDFAFFFIYYDFLGISKFPNPRFQKMLQYEHFLVIW